MIQNTQYGSLELSLTAIREITCRMGSHSITYLPPGRGDIPVVNQAKLVLDVDSTAKGCKAELT